MEQQSSYHRSLIESLKKNREFALVHLGSAAAALHSTDPRRRSYGRHALGNVIQAYGGPDKIAQDAGISREALDAALLEGGTPTPCVWAAALTAIGSCLHSEIAQAA